MKKLSLNTKERLILSLLLNAAKLVTLERFNMGIKIVDKIFLDSEEIKKIGLKTLNGQTSWEKEAEPKDVELSEDQSKLILSIMNEKDQRGDWTMDEARTALVIKEKLDEAAKEEKEAEK